MSVLLLQQELARLRADQTERASSVTDAVESDRLWHIYKGPWPNPVGAVALCGHVKDVPTIRDADGSEALCVVCSDLWGAV